MVDHINIRAISTEERFIAQEFLFKTIKELYNYDVNPSYHTDIINMKDLYIVEKRNIIIGAFDKDNNLVGTIALKQFTDRFTALKGMYKEYTTAELGRCYINEDLRRKGIGSLLFDSILEFSRESGYEKIYLHTHKHLPGGYDFWKKKGFIIRLEEENEEETVHMEKSLYHL